MQRPKPRIEPLLFGVVRSRDVPHVLTHDVPVEIGWPKGLLRHHPPGREYYEVTDSNATIG